MSDVAFARPDPAAFRRRDEPGPEIAGRLGPRRALEGVVRRHPTAARAAEGPGRKNHRGSAWGSACPN